LWNLIHHPVCSFVADTPPGQEGQSLWFVKYVIARTQVESLFCANPNHR